MILLQCPISTPALNKGTYIWLLFLPADSSISVPSTAGVSGALETAVVSDSAQVEVNLADAGVGGHVQLAPEPGDLHGADGLLLHGALEGVQQLGLEIAVIIRPLGHFVHVASLGANIKHTEFPAKKNKLDLIFILKESFYFLSP